MGVELTATHVTASPWKTTVQCNANTSVQPAMALSVLIVQRPRDDVNTERKALAYVAKLPRLSWLASLAAVARYDRPLSDVALSSCFRNKSGVK